MYCRHNNASTVDTKLAVLSTFKSVFTFTRVRKIAENNYQLHHASVFPSNCPHGTTRLPLDGFS
jgi:hypothetical protein